MWFLQSHYVDNLPVVTQQITHLFIGCNVV